MKKPLSNPDYPAFLAAIKERILHARTSAARAVNRDLILLYWDIRRGIVEKQQLLGWGESVIDRLSADLKEMLPGVTGFSPRNLRDMKRFYLAFAEESIWRQVVAKMPKGAKTHDSGIWRQAVAEPSTADRERGVQIPPQTVASLEEDAEAMRQMIAEIPWGHHLVILNSLSDPAARFYYLRATAQFGWSRNVLLNQIKAGACERAVKEKKAHNFPLALPEHFAEHADEMMKSRYNLEFLGINRAVKERELEDRLVAELQRFILELGYGFCFVGRQYRLALGRKEYYVDLLFYHRFLKALVAFDLKIGPFEPEHAGKMDFCLNLLNDKERAADDQPSIGIILCAEKDDVEVEFALKTKQNPIGVAEYKMQPKLPREFKGCLPSARQLTEAVRGMLSAEKPSRRK